MSTPRRQCSRGNGAHCGYGVRVLLSTVDQGSPVEARMSSPQSSAPPFGPSFGRTVDMSRQLAGTGARVAWYYALNRLVDRRASQLGAQPTTYRPKRPVPDQRELFAELGQLLVADAMAVQAGLYPPMTDAADSPLTHVQRIRAMFADLPEALARRVSRRAVT
jgi:hypothetical protein